jgi:hypothetical protein
VGPRPAFIRGEVWHGVFGVASIKGIAFLFEGRAGARGACVVGVGTARDTTGTLVGAAVGGGVIVTGTVGAFFVGYAGAADVSVQLAFVASDWLAEVLPDSDDMSCDVHPFAEKVVSSFWRGTRDLK